MSEQTAPSGLAWQPARTELRARLSRLTGYWWVGLVAGIAWLVASIVILQFDSASITTVGILVGLLFSFAALEHVAIGSVPSALRVPSIIFAVLFGIAAVVSFIEPVATFAGVADMLGFLFLTVGIWWMVRAFLERPLNPAWWLGLISGILMTVLAFWTAGQFFIGKAYVLLVFAGIWALMQGIGDIVRAFAVHRVHEQL